MSIRSKVKHIPRALTAPFLRRRSVRDWPAVAAKIHDLSVPKAVIPHPDPCPRGEANINIILDLIDRVENIEGDVAECGVYRGNTLVPLALYLRSKGVSKDVFAFDSFEGFPDHELRAELTLDQGGDPNKSTKGFTDTSSELVRRKLKLFQLTNVEIHKGYFCDSLPQCSTKSFSFVHLDCDLYGSYKECLEFFYPRLNSRGILLLDEYNDPPWPGCNKAVNEFLADKPERLQEIERQNYQKYFFAKI